MLPAEWWHTLCLMHCSVVISLGSDFCYFFSVEEIYECSSLDKSVHFQIIETMTSKPFFLSNAACVSLNHAFHYFLSPACTKRHTQLNTYKNSCNMPCVFSVGGSCPFIQLENKVILKLKCPLTISWKAVGLHYTRGPSIT